MEINDLEILKQIEKELGVTFEETSDKDIILSVGKQFTTYSIDSNQNIVGLRIIGGVLNNLILISKLKKLQILYFIGNNISDISALKNLKNISILFLLENQIKDISVLKNFKKISTLFLFGNQITDISPIKSFFKKEKFLYSIDDNPLKFPPKEIVELGKEAINEYFDHAEQGTSILREAKLIIIGEAGAGKTSFAKKIQNSKAEMPKPEETTRGIDIFNWQFDAEFSTDFSGDFNTGFNAKLWDFGGQDIYHGTHQFFFSNKSLYVLLADAREQKTDFNYWLNTIEQLTGQDSPLVIILNKKQNHSWKIDEPGLKNRFGNIINKIVSIDLSDANEVLELQEIIKNQIRNLPQIGYTLPTSWVKIRQELTKIEKKFISFEKFREICAINGISSPKVIEIISKLFTNIGIFTHFIEEETNLQDIIFLDSNWLTETVYSLLNSEIVNKKQGRINREEIKEILQNDELYFEIDKFVELLKKFSLIYKINGSPNYIVPEHLPQIQPYSQWKYANKSEVYQFRYLFDNYMPKGIMAKLIVALHQFIYDNNLAWHRGVNIANSIKNPETFAEILETYGRENRFDIKIYGKNKSDLLQTIIYHFDRILKPFTKLTHTKLIPCNCDTCKTNNKPHFYSYTKLLDRKKNNKKTIECSESPYFDVDIDELLFGINVTELRSLLINKKFDEFKDLIFQKFTNISYQIHTKKVSESFFHSNFHTILAENGLNPISEESTGDGRIDLHLTIGKIKYLFELKKDESAENALEQIHKKEYYKKFQRDFKEIILIGINFSSKKRNIVEIKTQTLSA